MKLSDALARCVFVAMVALPSFVRSDTVYLKGGGKLEGEVSEQGDRVIVKNAIGTLRIDRAKVVRIEREESIEAEYKRRAAALDAKDADGHYGLGLWLRQKRRRELAQQEFERAVAIDPNHGDARRALHHVFHNGTWYTQDQAANVAGLVKYMGRWLTPAEAEKAKAQDEALRAQRALQTKVNQSVRKLLSPNPTVRNKAREQLLALADQYQSPKLKELVDRMSRLRRNRGGGRPVTMEIRASQTSPVAIETFTFTNIVNGQRVTNTIQLPVTQTIGIQTTATAPGG